SLAIPVYFTVMTALHHDVHQLVISEIEQRALNEDSAAQLEQANARLSEQATRDQLTGVANRAALTAELRRAVARARQTGTTIGVLYIDLDRFKVVNDSLGHGAGDALLVLVAQRIREAIRGCDVVARLGGDEFTVLLDSLESDDDARRIA